MTKIVEGLFQSSRLKVPLVFPKEINTVFWMCGAPPRDLKRPTITLFDYEIEDDPAGLPEDVFEDLFNLVSQYSQTKILSVCEMGENRSGLVSAMVLVARGFTPEQAIKIVQDRATPTFRTHCLWNQGFQRNLLEMFSK